jgi:hypothetical protein
MMALTISQPFASLIAAGEKWVENRTWETLYRGPLAIHAGKGAQYLAREDLAHFDTGCVVAVAKLVHCFSVTFLQRQPAGFRFQDSGRSVAEILGHDHTEGPWCWVLADVRRLDRPIAASGQRGLWDWEPPVGMCQVCGCTEDHACAGGCHWVKPSLCSACAEKSTAEGAEG